MWKSTAVEDDSWRNPLLSTAAIWKKYPKESDWSNAINGKLIINNCKENVVVALLEED